MGGVMIALRMGRTVQNLRIARQVIRSPLTRFGMIAKANIKLRMFLEEAVGAAAGRSQYCCNDLISLESCGNDLIFLQVCSALTTVRLNQLLLVFLSMGMLCAVVTHQ